MYAYIVRELRGGISVSLVAEKELPGLVGTLIQLRDHVKVPGPPHFCRVQFRHNL